MSEMRRYPIEKYKSDLRDSGRAIIVFGVWTILKFALIRLYDSNERVNLLGIDMIIPFDIRSIAVLFVIIIAADLALRFFIGRSAILHSRGRKMGWRYIYVAGIYMIYCFGVDAIILVDIFMKKIEFAQITSTLFDAASNVATVLIVVNGTKLNRIYQRKRTKDAA